MSKAKQQILQLLDYCDATTLEAVLNVLSALVGSRSEKHGYKSKDNCPNQQDHE